LRYITNSLSVKSSCQIGIIFSPKTTGTRTANLELLDNTLTGTDTVILNGTGILTTPALAITSPKLGQTCASGSTLTFTVTVPGVTGLPAPTGTVKFGVNGVVQGSPVTLSNGAASITLSGLATGSSSLTASYSGDSNYAAAGPIGSSINISAPAVVSTKVTLVRTTAKAESCSAAAFAVDVTSKSAVLPSGEVELFNGKMLIASGTPVNGKVTLKAALKAGTEMGLVAHYLGNKRHTPGESATLRLTTTKTVPCEVV
jgi:trimeric autotransporter adhesin